MSNFIKQQPIILASGSSSRQALLRTLGIHFEIVHSGCDEEAIKIAFKGSSMIDLAKTLARQKALTVSQRFPKHTVIAADQLCVIGNQYLDKPGSHAIAVEHLRLLSGNTHQQIAACCIAQNGEVCRQFEETASLTMHTLDDQTIENYLRLDMPYQSCGAYHYEGQAKWLFRAVTGSEDTILGLPLNPLTNHLMDLGVIEFGW